MLNSVRFKGLKVRRNVELTCFTFVIRNLLQILTNDVSRSQVGYLAGAAPGYILIGRAKHEGSDRRPGRGV